MTACRWKDDINSRPFAEILP